MKQELKECEMCSKPFKQFNSTQKVCSGRCALDYARGKTPKKQKKELKELKERLKTKGQHLKELQIIFNKFIRLRDKGKNCISCDAKIKGNGHASHFFSVGSNPALRFNENNAHCSCEYCNTYLHGNLYEYSIRLPERIGEREYQKLLASKGEKLHLSIPEIEMLKTIYKNKIKDLE